MKIALALLLAAAAGTCNAPVANPPSAPIEIPDIGDDTGPTSTPETDCEVAWTVMVDAECPPPSFHEAWLNKCADLPKPTLDCVMTAESCATMRNCLGAFP